MPEAPTRVPAKAPVFEKGFYYPPPRCANCIPKNRGVEAALEMVKTTDPDGYICPKCGKILLWYDMPEGCKTLDSLR